MKEAYPCDIVKNLNPKSKKFGQCGVIYGLAYSGRKCTYVNYSDGKTIYQKIDNLALIHRFGHYEDVGYGRVCECNHWGILRVIDKDGHRSCVKRSDLWKIISKYTKATIV